MAANTRWLFGLTFALAVLMGSKFVYAADEQAYVDLATSLDITPTKRFESRDIADEAGVHCISFYAQALGNSETTLSLYLVKSGADTSKTAAPITKFVISNDHLQLRFFKISEQTGPFKVVIDVAKTDSRSDKIHLVDVEIRKGGCLTSEASCDFERYTWCKFRNSPETRDTNLWKMFKPKSAIPEGPALKTPKVDVTTSTSSGGYMRVAVGQGKSTAVLLTGKITAGRSCLLFYYAVTGSGYLLVKKYNGNEEYGKFPDPEYPYQEAEWDMGLVHIEADEPFKVAFQAVPASDGTETWFALDDVKVLDRGCHLTDMPVEPVSKKLIPGPSCNFDTGCRKKWKSTKSSTYFQWVSKTGEDKKQPRFDHSVGSSRSPFKYVAVTAYATKHNKNSKSVLSGPSYTWKDPHCVSFWYFMHGSTVPKLSVYHNSDGRKIELWAREGNQGPAWHQGLVHVPSPKNPKGNINFVATATQTGNLAIDEVEFLEGPCPVTEDVCDFEDLDTCGYQQGGWVVDKASLAENITGIDTDHSQGTSEGSYLYGNTADSGFQKTPDFVSPLYHPTEGRCLKFHYFINNKDKDSESLQVHVRTEEGDKFSIGSFTGLSSSGSWLMADMNIVSVTYFQIVFSGVADRGVISLDQIQLSKYPCKQSYGCDFEQGFCSWTSRLEDGSSLAWQITSGHLPEGEMGPSRDVTQNSQFGHFIYLQTTDPAEANDVAILKSQELTAGTCLSFFFSMIGDGVGQLYVNYTDAVSTRTLWSKDGFQGSKPAWRQAWVDLPGDQQNKDFRLSLVGTVGATPGHTIAIDEIKVYMDHSCSHYKAASASHDFHCSAKDTSGNQVTIKRSQMCDFVKDCPDGEDEQFCGDCRFDEESSWFCHDSSDVGANIGWLTSWQIPRAVKDSYPRRPRDNKKSNRGDFLTVESIQPGTNDITTTVATYSTGIWAGPSPPTCQLQFYYYVDGDYDPTGHHPPPLRVVMRQADEDTVIFVADRSTLSWLKTTVEIGSIPTRFQIAFLGYRRPAMIGNTRVAIDDVKYTNCEFPPVVKNCVSDQFRCSRGACIDYSRVCDFNDDCGDGSDEEHCDDSMYLLRTNFEEGFGDWLPQVDPKTSKSSWIIQDGRSAEGSREQPRRDHTLGTLNGHYMVLHYDRDVEDFRDVVSPVLVATLELKTCHLRLYYYIAGLTAPRLTISTRTSKLGEMTKVLTRFTSHGETWTRADIGLEGLHDPFQIVISAEFSDMDAALAIDDISMFGCAFNLNQTLPEGSAPDLPKPCDAYEFQCNDGTCLDQVKVNKCNFVNDCVDGTDEMNCGSCDFENSMCGWHDESLGLYSWKHRTAFQQPEPSSDATFDTEGEGHFLLLNTHSAGVDKDPALLLSPLLADTDPNCQFSFSYFTNIDPDHIDDAIMVGGQGRDQVGTDVLYPLPKVAGSLTKRNEWSRVNFTVGRVVGQFRLVIKHDYRKFSDFVAIAIDDTKFENCAVPSQTIDIQKNPSDLACTFKDGTFCNFNLVPLAGREQWIPSQVAGDDGKRVRVVMASNLDQIVDKEYKSAILVSDYIEPTGTDVCLTVKYMTHGADLAVWISNAERLTYLFSHNNMKYTWQETTINIAPQLLKFMVVIRARGSKNSGSAYINDIKVALNKCPPKPICGFDMDQCGYTTDEDSAWTRSKGYYRKTAAPAIDHTNNDELGFYMTVKQSGDYTSPAQLVSPLQQQPARQDSCTYFWYRLHKAPVGSLAVRLRLRGSTDSPLLWEMSGEQGDRWLQGRVTIPKHAGDYYLIFEAVPQNGKFGSISIDDVQNVQGGGCPLPGSCDFDTDMCGYTNVLSDRDDDTAGQWLRMVEKHVLTISGVKDHTSKVKNGGFAVQFPAGLGDNSTAKMLSPVLPETSKACVSFWYFFDGPADGTFTVTAGKETFSVHTKSDVWRHGYLKYQSDSTYQIMFEGTVSNQQPIRMAVDDIVVSEGECVKPKPPPIAPQGPDDDTGKATPPKKDTDIPATGSADNSKFCDKHCDNWKSCQVTGKDTVTCVCLDGFTGDDCAEPVEHIPWVPHHISPAKPSKPGSGKTHTQRKNNDSGSAGLFGMSPAIIGAIAAAVVLVVLALAVFIYLARTNRICRRAPRALQRTMPAVFPPPPSRGTSNPVYSYSISPDSGEGIVNPVYGESGESFG